MKTKQRRIAGFWVGAILGLIYLLIAQFINVWALPGIPLFDLPIGRITTTLLGTLVMGALGVIVAWEEEPFWGVLGGAAFIVVISYIQAYVNSGESRAINSIILFIYTFLPTMIVYVPAGLFMRWVMRERQYAMEYPRAALRHWLNILVAVPLVAVFAGSFSLYTAETRDALKAVNALTLEGLASRKNLPEELLPVEGFAEYAQGAYTLEWSSDVDSLPVTRPRVGIGVVESLIIVRFENGYQFGCVHTPPQHLNCINVTRVMR